MPLWEGSWEIVLRFHVRHELMPMQVPVLIDAMKTHDTVSSILQLALSALLVRTCLTATAFLAHF